MNSYELLEKLCNLPGVTGFEEAVRETIAKIVEPMVDELRVDTLGNLIAIRRGLSGFRLMLDAHMDEIGFLVQHIDEQGFIRIVPVGSWDQRLLPSHLLTIVTADGRRIEGVVGTQPPHILRPFDMDKVIPMEEMFLDIGATTRQEVVAAGVSIGDPILAHYPFRRIGRETVAGKALDDRAGCAAIIRTLQALQGAEIEATVVAAFVVAEERGMMGARTAAYQAEPDLAIVVEGTTAADIPGVPPQRQPSGQGKGPVITVADNSFIAPRRLVKALEDTAVRESIPYQIKTPCYGSTDAGVIHQSRAGIFTGIVSVPCRYIHSPFSTCRLSDFDYTWKLLAAFCREATRIDRA
ncbi:MAG: M20/M25/M40 family metallo-hydrolase [Syntrophotaleaceae bacterium]